MSFFRVQGGKKLQGEITPQGAKNEALQVICATLLTTESVTISNIPNILDVSVLMKIVSDLGCRVVQLNANTYTFTTPSIDIGVLNTPEYHNKTSKMRGAIMLLGPLLVRCGHALIPEPGGDRIGRRKLDTHFIGLQALGARFQYDEKNKLYKINTPHNLQANHITLEEASVTGTANIIMVAAFTPGKTTLYNAACEPYIQQLCLMLNNMGAKIYGIGSNLLTVEGVNSLSGTTHTLLPDMIEIGSFIGMAAITQSSITIKNCQIETLGLIPSTFKKMGITLEYQGDNIHIPAQEHYTIKKTIDGSLPKISDAPWPGLTPDIISVVLVTAIQANGALLIHQKMFESRLFFVDKLIDMGAQIILCDPHRATIIGIDHKKSLRAIKMTSPDIRAGIALLIAALSAEGESIIYNIEQIERGYQDISHRLNQLGADISVSKQ